MKNNILVAWQTEAFQWHTTWHKGWKPTNTKWNANYVISKHKLVNL